MKTIQDSSSFDSDIEDSEDLVAPFGDDENLSKKEMTAPIGLWVGHKSGDATSSLTLEKWKRFMDNLLTHETKKERKDDQQKN